LLVLLTTTVHAEDFQGRQHSIDEYNRQQEKAKQDQERRGPGCADLASCYRPDQPAGSSRTEPANRAPAAPYQSPEQRAAQAAADQEQQRVRAEAAQRQWQYDPGHTYLEQCNSHLEAAEPYDPLEAGRHVHHPFQTDNPVATEHLDQAAEYCEAANRLVRTPEDRTAASTALTRLKDLHYSKSYLGLTRAQRCLAFNDAFSDEVFNACRSVIDADAASKPAASGSGAPAVDRRLVVLTPEVRSAVRTQLANFQAQREARDNPRIPCFRDQIVTSAITPPPANAAAQKAFDHSLAILGEPGPMTRGRLDDEIADLRKAVKLAPTNATYWESLASTLFSRTQALPIEKQDPKDWLTIIDAYEHSLTLDPRYPVIWAYLGDALGSYNEFLMYKKSLPHRIVIDTKLAWQEFTEHEAWKAKHKQAYERAAGFASAPNDPNLKSYNARFHYDTKPVPPPCSEPGTAAAEAVNLPVSPNAVDHQAPRLAVATAASPSSGAPVTNATLGRAAFERGRKLQDDDWVAHMTDIVSAFREAVRLSPTEADYHEALGLTLRRQKDWHGAAVEYREVARLAPQRWDTYATLGLVLSQLHDFAGAADAYRTAVSRPGPLWSDYLSLADVLTSLDRRDEAMGAFEAAIRLDPTDNHLATRKYNEYRSAVKLPPIASSGGTAH
jgi:tetratricopeptide (TPR) repeat protein